MNRILRLTFLASVLAISSQAAVFEFFGSLFGFNENPPNASPGHGSAIVTYDSVAHSLNIDVMFADLVGVTTAAHIHCCVDPPGNVGVATQVPSFAGFPVGVTSGTYNNTFDLTLDSSWNATFLTNNGGAAGAEAALFAGMLAERAYLNIHSNVFPGGEIRDFLTIVPEPGTWILLSGGLLAFGLWSRRKLS